MIFQEYRSGGVSVTPSQEPRHAIQLMELPRVRWYDVGRGQLHPVVNSDAGFTLARLLHLSEQLVDSADGSLHLVAAIITAIVVEQPRH